MKNESAGVRFCLRNMLTTFFFAIVVVLIGGALAPAIGQILDMDRVGDPIRVCKALIRYNLDSGSTWRESRSTPGGWVCGITGATVEFGRSGPLGLPSNISYFVFGSGRQKIDRVTLKLNGNDPASVNDGRVRLKQASNALLEIFGLQLSDEIRHQIEQYPFSIRSQPQAEPRRVLREERHEKFVIRLEAEETRLTSLVFSIENVHASGLW